MKITKSTTGNVLLDQFYYSERQLEIMFVERQIFYFDKNMEVSYNYWDRERRTQKRELRVFVEEGDELKVVLFNDCFVNVLLKKDGCFYFVKF